MVTNFTHSWRFANSLQTCVIKAVHQWNVMLTDRDEVIIKEGRPVVIHANSMILMEILPYRALLTWCSMVEFKIIYTANLRVCCGFSSSPIKDVRWVGKLYCSLQCNDMIWQCFILGGMGLIFYKAVFFKALHGQHWCNRNAHCFSNMLRSLVISLNG